MNEEEIISEYTINKIPLRKLAKYYHTSQNKIKEILLKNNINIRTRSESSRKYSHTYNYFENIDTEYKAYWLGFILADGYISINKGHNTLGIEIKNTDINHLYKFKKDICATNPIKEYHKNSTFGEQDNCRISLSSEKTISGLIKLGITPNKSYDGIFPIIDEQFNKYMIRGYFDGNGSIVIGNYGSISLSFCGTKDILKNIEDISGFKWSWYQRHPERDVNNYSISTGKQLESKKFLKYMYEDSNVFLERKYEKYKYIIENNK